VQEAWVLNPDGRLWMRHPVAPAALQRRCGRPEDWSKPLDPNHHMRYGLSDMAWDPSGRDLGGGGRPPTAPAWVQGATGEPSWQRDPVGAKQRPTKFNRIAFTGNGKGFVLGRRNRANMLRWARLIATLLTNGASGARQRVALRICSADSPAAMCCRLHRERPFFD